MSAPFCRRTVALFAAVVACAFVQTAWAGQDGAVPYLAVSSRVMKAPGLSSGTRVPIGRHPRTGYERFLAEPVQGAQRPLFLGLLAFYRTVISPVNGDQSDVAPVHALYAVQAIKAYGVLLGTVLTTERLIHEPDELARGPVFSEDGREFTYDPLVGNTYWLPDWMR